MDQPETEQVRGDGVVEVTQCSDPENNGKHKVAMIARPTPSGLAAAALLAGAGITDAATGDLAERILRQMPKSVRQNIRRQREQKALAANPKVKAEADRLAAAAKNRADIKRRRKSIKRMTDAMRGGTVTFHTPRRVA